MSKQSTSVIFFIGLFLVSCAETASVKNDKYPTSSLKSAENKAETEQKQQKDALDYNPDAYIIKLGDNYEGRSNDLPDALKSDEVIAEEKAGVESDLGYRVQLISTNNRERAERIIADFNEWIFSTESITYKAEAYLIYKQPYYRVHIGDFKTRIQANEFMKLVKRRFSDAWIIQDQINQDLVPNFVK